MHILPTLEDSLEDHRGQMSMTAETQMLMYRKDHWLGVEVSVKYKGISRGGPHAHPSHEDLLSLLPVILPS